MDCKEAEPTQQKYNLHTTHPASQVGVDGIAVAWHGHGEQQQQQAVEVEVVVVQHLSRTMNDEERRQIGDVGVWSSR